MDWIFWLVLALVLLWLLSRYARRQPSEMQVDAVLFDRGLAVEVVGESHYQDALERVCGGRTEDGSNHECIAGLIPEPSNPFDPNAVLIRIDGYPVGYLSRHAAEAYKPIAARLEAIGKVGAAHATIVGGWDRGQGDRGHFGVRIDMNPFTWLEEQAQAEATGETSVR